VPAPRKLKTPPNEEIPVKVVEEPKVEEIKYALS
jgi:hypothetical protein